MLKNSIDAIREERARFARDVEYLKETAIDDEIDERLEISESNYTMESAEELEEAMEMVNRLPGEEDLLAESAEVEAILDATENLTFNEMVGID